MIVNVLLSLLGKLPLKDILLKLFGAGANALVAWLENLGKGDVEKGKALLEKLQPMANRIVASVEEDMPDADGDEKRRAAFAHLGETLRKFDLRTSQINALIELAVQHLDARK